MRKQLIAKRERLQERWASRCAYCGTPVSFAIADAGLYPTADSPMQRASIDHVVPISRGGSRTPENEVLACWPCNANKATKTLAEWLESPSCRVNRWRSFASVLAAA